MSLTPWVAFVAACAHGTLGAVAQELGYTQSAVSRQIASLEHELGVVLLERRPRGVRPTPAGAAVLVHARLLVAEAERAQRAANQPRSGRHLAVGAVPSMAIALLPTALRSADDLASWTLVTGLTPTLVERVAAHELDLAVVTDAPPGLPGTAGVTFTHLFDDPMAVLLPARTITPGRLRLGDLADEVWLEEAETVGLTSGASAPEKLVDRVCDWFRARGVDDISAHRIVEEDVEFRLPVELRRELALAEAQS